MIRISYTHKIVFLKYPFAFTYHISEINKFSVLSSDEKKHFFGRIRNYNNRDGLAENSQPKVAVKNLPSFVDWRANNYVTPIKDQGPCGKEILFCNVVQILFYSCHIYCQVRAGLLLLLKPSRASQPYKAEHYMSYQPSKYKWQTNICLIIRLLCSVSYISYR